MGKFIRQEVLNGIIKRFFWTIVFVVCLYLWGGETALAQDVSTTIETIPRQHRLEIVSDLETRGILTPVEANQQRDYYNAQPDQTKPDALSDRNTPPLWQRVRGVLTISHIIWIFSSILLVFSLGLLARLYLFPLLGLIPGSVYELAAYFISIGTMVGSYWLEAPLDEYLALPGCLSLIGALAFSYYLHPQSCQKLCRTFKTNPYSLGSLLTFLTWSSIAIVHQSSVIGFISAIALEAYLGFAIAVFPGTYMFGFTKRSLLPRAVISSLALLIFYVTIRLSAIQLPSVLIFAPGILFVGTFVYFLGLLIWSSKWYRAKKTEYITLQFVTIVSGIIALYLGSLGQISQLQGIGGTFFFLYIIEKYFELPWRKKTIAWAIFGFALLLFASAGIIEKYPQYFLFM